MSRRERERALRVLKILVLALIGASVYNACCDVVVTRIETLRPASIQLCSKDSDCARVCADATCNLSTGLCEYTLHPGCPCYEGQDARSVSQCSSHSEQCVVVGNTTHWECNPSDCQPRSIGCNTALTATQVCTDEHYWGSDVPCPTGQVCNGGACVCSCQEGAQRCGGNSGHQVCHTCQWVDEPCPPGNGCQGGACVCSEGARSCLVFGDSAPVPIGGSPRKDVAICRNSRWELGETCAPGTCVDGACTPAQCGSGIWCPARGRCVPRCNKSNCEVLDAQTLTCVNRCPSRCQAGKCGCFANGLCPVGPLPGEPIVTLAPCPQ